MRHTYFYETRGAAMKKTHFGPERAQYTIIIHQYSIKGAVSKGEGANLQKKAEKAEKTGKKSLDTLARACYYNSTSIAGSIFLCPFLGRAAIEGG